MMNGYALGLREGAIEEARKSEESLEPLLGLLLAVNEGRVAVLPCKIGKTVYVIDKKHKCEACVKKTVCCDKTCKTYRSNDIAVKMAHVYAATLLNGEGCMELIMHASVYGDSEQYGYSIEFMEEDIGKNVFLSCEEAEQALKGERHAEIH